MMGSLATTGHCLSSTGLLGNRRFIGHRNSTFQLAAVKSVVTQKTRFGHHDSRQANALLISVALVGNHDVVAEAALFNSSVPAHVALLH